LFVSPGEALLIRRTGLFAARAFRIKFWPISLAVGNPSEGGCALGLSRCLTGLLRAAKFLRAGTDSGIGGRAVELGGALVLQDTAGELPRRVADLLEL
jgi:hypothetical protein